MKEWPEFNENGDLPIGIFRATIKDVLEHFGKGCRQREMIAHRLERIALLQKQVLHLREHEYTFGNMKQTPKTIAVPPVVFWLRWTG